MAEESTSRRSTVSRRRPRVVTGNPLQYLAWRIPWTEEPGGLQSMGSQNSQTRLSDWAQMQRWLYWFLRIRDGFPIHFSLWWARVSRGRLLLLRWQGISSNPANCLVLFHVSLLLRRVLPLGSGHGFYLKAAVPKLSVKVSWSIAPNLQRLHRILNNFGRKPLIVNICWTLCKLLVWNRDYSISATFLWCLFMKLFFLFLSFGFFFFFLIVTVTKSKKCVNINAEQRVRARISNLIPRLRCVITQANFYLSNVVLKLICKASSMNQLWLSPFSS